MLALVMCLLVLAIAGAAVLHGAVPARPSKRTGPAEPAPRASRRERRRPAPAAPPARPRPVAPPRRLRSGCLLALASIGIGVLTGLVLGLVVVVVGLALRSL